jgi:hypothetical protein
LLPRDDIGRVLFMPGDAVIKLGPLRIGQRCRVRFQAFPDCIEQVGLLRCGEAVDLASKIAHNPITVPRPRPACKRILSAMVLFFLSVKQTEQHFFDAAGDGGLELLLDSGRVAGFRWPWSAPWVKGYEKECGKGSEKWGTRSAHYPQLLIISLHLNIDSITLKSYHGASCNHQHIDSKGLINLKGASYG